MARLRLSKGSTALFFLLLGACGTYVPEIQEFPGNQVASQLLVRAIVRSIHCELRNAITYVINEDKRLASSNYGVRNAPWLDNWGVQVGLTLTIQEKSAVGPNVAWNPAGPANLIFSLLGGASISSDATRINKLGFYYTVRELYARGSCPPNDNADAPPGSFLIQSDLKLRQWLVTQVLIAGTGEINIPTTTDAPPKQNALSHQLTFEVISSANVTPGWKLTEVGVNQSGPFFSTSRRRTHDLLLAFGPIDAGIHGLVGAAASSYLASEIGIANDRVR